MVNRGIRYMKIGDSRYRVPPEKRKSGGFTWRYYMWAKSKTDAQKEADRQTNSYGLLTKLFPYFGGWAIYFRHK